MSSADNFYKQFRPRSGLTIYRARSESKLFDTLMLVPKEFFEKVDFEKKIADDKKYAKLPSRQSVKPSMVANPEDRPQHHKTFSIPNSSEDEIYHAHKC